MNCDAPVNGVAREANVPILTLFAAKRAPSQR
jgi:hypothetical protein